MKQFNYDISNEWNDSISRKYDTLIRNELEKKKNKIESRINNKRSSIRAKVSKLHSLTIG